MGLLHYRGVVWAPAKQTAPLPEVGASWSELRALPSWLPDFSDAYPLLTPIGPEDRATLSRRARGSVARVQIPIGVCGFAGKYTVHLTNRNMVCLRRPEMQSTTNGAGYWGTEMAVRRRARR